MLTKPFILLKCIKVFRLKTLMTIAKIVVFFALDIVENITIEILLMNSPTNFQAFIYQWIILQEWKKCFETKLNFESYEAELKDQGGPRIKAGTSAWYVVLLKTLVIRLDSSAVTSSLHPSCRPEHILTYNLLSLLFSIIFISFAIWFLNPTSHHPNTIFLFVNVFQVLKANKISVRSNSSSTNSNKSQERIWWDFSPI